MNDERGHNCQSCGMTIEAGPYCRYCVDENGVLFEFDESFARMVQFMKKRDGSLSQADAEQATRAYMATMPAWRDHPKLAGG